MSRDGPKSAILAEALGLDKTSGALKFRPVKGIIACACASELLILPFMFLILASINVSSGEREKSRQKEKNLIKM
jgi:hypothetical protein